MLTMTDFRDSSGCSGGDIGSPGDMVCNASAVQRQAPFLVRALHVSAEHHSDRRSMHALDEKSCAE